MRILIVEDDRASLESLTEFLMDLGHDVTGCKDGKQALESFEEAPFELVLTDIRMPIMTGVELLYALKRFKHQRYFEVILFTGHGDMESAIEALRAGARDYLLKPINVQELANIVERVAESVNDKRPAREGTTEEAHADRCFDMDRVRLTHLEGIGEIGVNSKKTQRLYEEALRLHGDRDIPVLIEGETGTGKEVLARLIHFGISHGEERPFVDINCAALTPSLFESELFGYEAGAYTGGLQKGNMGKIDIASGGTLFLDEIGEMSLDLQAKLLRVLQQKEFYRVGGLNKIKTDIRLICATNVNLEEKVKQGQFREDLYYRLNVGRVVVPPLKERKEEILYLAMMFLDELNQLKGKKISLVSKEAKKVLLNYDWPGNVRELHNIIEWAVFCCDGEEIMPGHLRIYERAQSDLLDKGSKHVESKTCFLRLQFDSGEFSLEEHIDHIVLEALEYNAGNKAKTADLLGISRKALYNRLERIEDKGEQTG